MNTGTVYLRRDLSKNEDKMGEDSTLERPSVSGQLLDNFNYSKTSLAPWISYKFCKMTVLKTLQFF